MLAILTEDSDGNLARTSAKKLNPPASFKRFEEQTRVEGGFMSNDAIVIAPDGASIYAAGSRDLAGKKGKAKDTREVVAFDLRGRRLERRWAFEFPSGGDSVQGMACSADGRSIFAVRARYHNDVAEALVMRFGPDDSRPLAQHRFAASPSNLAVWADGSRCAVSSHDERLFLLGEDLQPIHERKLGVRPYGLHFLAPTDLLVATPAAILRLDPETDAPPTVIDVPARHLSADDSGTLLSVSAWSSLTDLRQPKPFPVHLLDRATLKVIKTIGVSGYQCKNGALSPDGKRIAFEGHDTASKRKYIFAFDVASGAELGLRRSEYVHALAFLRDSRTLAIGVAEFRKGESIDLWAVPGI